MNGCAVSVEVNPKADLLLESLTFLYGHFAVLVEEFRSAGRVILSFVDDVLQALQFCHKHFCQVLTGFSPRV